MLTELRISDFAVIDRLNIECTAGFLVFTGETGAGKSILVDALALLVGARATSEQIRAGAEEAVIEAAFTLTAGDPLIDRLHESGFLSDGEPSLIVRRVVSRSGRNRIYLNGQLAPLHLLQSLAGTLVDIHGQHEQQSLLSSQAQLDALDAFGRLRDLRADYARAYDRWQERQRDLEASSRAFEDRRAREDLLRYQQRELEEAQIRPGEDEELAQERQRLAHAHRLSELADRAYSLIYGNEESLLGGMGQVRACLKELASIDAGAGEWTQLCEQASVHLQELASTVRAYRDKLDQDPSRLAAVEDRLDRLHRLFTKYGGDLASLLVRAESVRSELDALSQGGSQLADLRQAVKEDRGAVEDLARRLSLGRTRAASKFEVKLSKELAALRMERTQLKIAVNGDPTEQNLGPTGADRVEFLLSANRGEPLLPLARVASGGELSRVMLALKTVLANTDRVPVLIFDEVDAGVGGAVAAVMGKRLKALGGFHQVFCVTHLPQIASQADTHYLVEKGVTGGRTVTRVHQLDAAARREEIARMLGGLAITKAVRQTAAEMLDGTAKER